MDSVLTGALAALQPVNLLYCTLGCVVGTLIGVLPGIGPVATISLLLPLVIGLDPLSSIIMIAGIYYGAAYGGSITSILVNIPGEASTVVTCLDGYQMARQGRGGVALALAGVAGPEAANNAAASGSFIPLFVLGLPSNAAMALLLGAFTMYGLSPGPQMLSDPRGLFWGVVVSMYVGNVILVVLNLPLIGIWVRLLRAPYAILFPFILLFMLIGTYAMAKNPFDVYLLVGFGVIGYLLRKADYELAPLILAYVLGNQMETAFRQTLLIGRGSFDFLLGRPITLGILGVTLLVLAASLAARVRQSRAALIAKLEED